MKKEKAVGRKRERKQPAHKIGGIWVDPMCFPHFDR